MGQAVEHFFVQAFVSEFPVEALDEAILLRLAWRDIVPSDAGFVLPFEDGAAGQFSAVIRDDSFRLAVEPDAAIQFPGDTRA